MKNLGISEMITYSTVLIRCKYKDGTSGTGTGFIINLCSNKETGFCVPVLITNKHVINNNIECVFDFCKKDANNNPIDTERFSFTYNNTNWMIHPDSKVDLCCLPLAHALNELQKTPHKIFYIPLETNLIPTEEQLKELEALEEVVMFGYPIGLSDQFNNKPIIRKGITATHIKNKYQGKNEFLVDIACFPGSSGSPIFICNQGSYVKGQSIIMGSRVLLVGVLYAGPQYSASGVITFASLPKVPTPIVNIPTNLGVAIKSSEILYFENYFKSQLEGNSNEQA